MTTSVPGEGSHSSREQPYLRKRAAQLLHPPTASASLPPVTNSVASAKPYPGQTAVPSKPWGPNIWQKSFKVWRRIGSAPLYATRQQRRSSPWRCSGVVLRTHRS